MYGSAPSNTLFDASTVGLLLGVFLFIFTVHLLIVESLLLFMSVALFTLLSVDNYPLVSVSPPAFASGFDPPPLAIVTDHPIADSDRKIPGLFLPFGFNIVEFDD